MRQGNFPFTNTGPHPEQISPCPIVEAILEVRFSTSMPWAILLGKIQSRIGNRYPKPDPLPLSGMPEDARTQNPALMHLPLIKLLGDKFLIQTGPRVISLVTNPNSYEGWSGLRAELAALFYDIEQDGIVDQVERVGVRYINFFEGDVFPHLKIGGTLLGEPIRETNLAISTSFRADPFVAQLNVTNSAMVSVQGAPKMGSVLDLDVWTQPEDLSLLSNTLPLFDKAHDLEKQIFFGLLNSDFLERLNPSFV